MGNWSFKKTRTRQPLSRSCVPVALAFAALLLPGGARAQGIFDWPIRAALHPEAVLTGAGALFWNPGGLAGSVGTSQEIWITHVVGPPATGVRGVAAAGVLDLPWGFRGGLGYWHLGIDDIHRTTTSPDRQPGDIRLAEDVAVLGAANDLGNRTGGGAAIRVTRGSLGSDSRTTVEGEIGIQHLLSLPLSPQVGLSLRGLGGEPTTLAGAELSLPALASSRLPIRIGYGIQTDRKLNSLEHRLSLRASWVDRVHAGIALSYLGEVDGWTPLAVLGADLGRYSLSVLREALANNFGAMHFFRAAIRFP